MCCGVGEATWSTRLRICVYRMDVDAAPCHGSLSLAVSSIVMLELSIEAARHLQLAAQGLAAPPRKRATKDGVLATIRRMGALQIDTIHIVARSPYLVLWSRVGRYDPAWLDQLLAEGRLFEYWAHAACFLPIEEYPLFRWGMLHDRQHSREWMGEHAEVAQRVLATVHERGEVRSADFERTDGRGGTWWDWKPEKRALEVLFNLGELMIARRERFQRVYAPRDRILPEWDDAAMASPEESRRALVERTVRALGITTARWVPDYFRLRVAGVSAILESLVADGVLLPARIDGLKDRVYVHVEHVEAAEAAAHGRLRSSVTTLLSPFDPIVWHRERAEQLFGFAYKIETYTPADQRRYGYFTLPILHRGRLVGRLDPKAHRKEGVLEVRRLHLEPGVKPGTRLAGAVRKTLDDFALWQGLSEVVVRESDPPVFRELVMSGLGRG